MSIRKLNLKIEPVSGIYNNIEKCDLAIISIAPRSEVVNGYLRSKLLNQKFLLSKFHNNISKIIKNTFNENEISFLVLNTFDIPDFGKKMIRIARQFPDSALFVKGKAKGYSFLLWKNKNLLEIVKSGDFFEELLNWNGGVFLFQDVNLFHAN